MGQEHLSDFEKRKKSQEKMGAKEKEEKVQQLEKQRNISQIKFDLEKLKSLVEQGLIDQDLFEAIAQDNEISPEEMEQVLDQLDVQQIFEKIEEIEKIDGIDDMVPKEMRVTKQEYLNALQEPEQRQKTLTKLDNILDHLHLQMGGGTTGGLNLFSSFMYLLDKKLVLVQENTIDIKRNLEDR